MTQKVVSWGCESLVSFAFDDPRRVTAIASQQRRRKEARLVDEAERRKIDDMPEFQIAADNNYLAIKDTLLV